MFFFLEGTGGIGEFPPLPPLPLPLIERGEVEGAPESHPENAAANAAAGDDDLSPLPTIPPLPPLPATG